MNTNIKNAMQMMNLLKNGNPQQIALNLLQEQANQGNPTFMNLFELAKNGKTSDIEQVVRNMAKEKGVDFDKEFNSFKQTFGL